MTKGDPDHWLADELDHGFKSSRRRRPSFLARLLWRGFWTIAMIAVIYFGYIAIGEQAKSMILNMSSGQTKALPKQFTRDDSNAHEPRLPSSDTENLLRQKREAAWERHFKPSAACRDNPNTVDCANVYIRTRRAFDACYKD